MTPNAIRTAEFLDRMDSLFDLLNSTTTSARPGKEVIDRRNLEDKIKKLREFQSWISTWTFVDGNSKKEFMPFKTGWQITIDSICRISQYCIDSGFKFVGTRKFNQDCLEVSASNLLKKPPF